MQINFVNKARNVTKRKLRSEGEGKTKHQHSLWLLKVLLVLL